MGGIVLLSTDVWLRLNSTATRLRRSPIHSRAIGLLLVEEQRIVGVVLEPKGRLPSSKAHGDEKSGIIQGNLRCSPQKEGVRSGQRNKQQGAVEYRNRPNGCHVRRLLDFVKGHKDFSEIGEGEGRGPVGLRGTVEVIVSHLSQMGESILSLEVKRDLGGKQKEWQ